MSQRTHLVACFVKQFWWERTCSYTSTVCLEDTIYFTDTVRCHSKSGAGSRTYGIGRSHKRIWTEINIKHSTLRSFTKHALTILQQVIHFMFAIYEMELFQVFDTFQPCFFQFSKIVFIIQALQNLFVTSFRSSILLVEVMKNITYTNTVTAHFIRVSRTDTLTGSSYFSITFGCFVCSIQNTVCRKNKMSFLWNVQTFFQRMTRCFKCFCLCFKQCRIKYHTITDDVYLVSLKNTGRNRAKHIFLSFKLKRVTGIRAALKTSNHIILRC